MLVKYLGHSCFYFEWKNIRFIVDPFISGNSLASAVNIDEIRVDYILLTHGHADHVLDVERIAANNPDVKLVSNYEIINWFGQKGLTGIGMNTGGKVNLDALQLKSVAALHSSSMPDGTYGGLAGGFVIWDEEKSIYIAGDTALSIEMKLIPQICPALSAAILPVGDHFTMGYQDAILASQLIQCDQIIGCHFDTFDPIKINHEEVRNAFEACGKNITLANIGEVLEL